MILTKKQRTEFEEIVKPVMNYLGNPELFHPHVKIVIENGRAELFESVGSFVSDEFVPD